MALVWEQVPQASDYCVGRFQALGRMGFPRGKPTPARRCGDSSRGGFGMANGSGLVCGSGACAFARGLDTDAAKPSVESILLHFGAARNIEANSLGTGAWRARSAHAAWARCMGQGNGMPRVWIPGAPFGPRQSAVCVELRAQASPVLHFHLETGISAPRDSAASGWSGTDPASSVLPTPTPSPRILHSAQCTPLCCEHPTPAPAPGHTTREDERWWCRGASGYVGASAAN